MRCLVVKAHPLKDSLCSMLTEGVVDWLRENNHQVILEDLYADGFEAAMTPIERLYYYAGQYSSEAVKSQIENLLSAETIVLVFPTWWFGFPAILKGWFDRIWVPGVAYDHADDYGPIKPRLHNLRHMLVATTLGAPWWVDRIIMRQPVKRILKTAIVGTCAPGCRLQFVSQHKAESLTSIQIEKFWARISNALSSL